MDKKKIVIAGGTGFLGKALTMHFCDQGHEVVILTRRKREPMATERYAEWDGKTLGAWKEEVCGAHVLINLTGRSVDCRYTKENKAQILNSRVDATRVLGEAIKECVYAPIVWLNAASATIYRHSEDKEMGEENGEYGHGFSVNVCKAWEKELFEADTPNTRRVALRIAIVLGRNEGAMGPFVKMTKLGAGGPQGNGRQYFSWIHIDDFVNAVQFIIDHDGLEGPVNMVAPRPETNRDQMRLLREALGVKFGMPLFTWQIKLGAFIIGTSAELVLKSRRVVPTKLMEAGFVHQYPELGMAFKDLVD